MLKIEKGTGFVELANGIKIPSVEDGIEIKKIHDKKNGNCLKIIPTKKFFIATLDDVTKIFGVLEKWLKEQMN